MISISFTRVLFSIIRIARVGDVRLIRLSYVSVRLQLQRGVICWQTGLIDDFAHIHPQNAVIVQNIDFFGWRSAVM